MHAPAQSQLSRRPRIGIVGNFQCVGTQHRNTIGRIPVDTAACALGAEPVIVSLMEDAQRLQKAIA